MFILATLAPNGVVFQEIHQPPPPMELLNVFIFFKNAWSTVSLLLPSCINFTMPNKTTA